MTSKTGLKMALEIHLYGSEVSILGPTMLKVCYQFDEEGLVESLVRLILSDKQSALVAGSSFR